jgi:hypothetical protein
MSYSATSRSRRSASQSPPLSGCFKAVLIAFITLVVAGLVAVFVVGGAAKDLVDKWSGGFLTKVTQVKASNVLIDIGRTHGDVLEVASPLKTMELFSKSDSRFAAWGKVYLGTSTSEIKVPASYRYHIKLSEMKGTKMKDKELVVKVPAIYPSLPVAFDTAGVEKRSEDGWFRFDGEQLLAELEKNITPELERRAQQHLPVIKETARKDIELFVQKWIVESHPEHRENITGVRVVFEGENEEKILERPPLVP